MKTRTSSRIATCLMVGGLISLPVAVLCARMASGLDLVVQCGVVLMAGQLAAVVGLIWSHRLGKAAASHPPRTLQMATMVGLWAPVLFGLARLLFA